MILCYLTERWAAFHRLVGWWHFLLKTYNSGDYHFCGVSVSTGQDIITCVFTRKHSIYFPIYCENMLHNYSWILYNDPNIKPTFVKKSRHISPTVKMLITLLNSKHTIPNKTMFELRQLLTRFWLVLMFYVVACISL